MRVSAYSMTAGAVVLSATVLALPEWYKRGADAAKIFRCISNAIATAQLPSDCIIATAIDVGIFQRVDADDLNIDFTLPEPNVLTLSSSKLSAKLLSVPGISWPVAEATQHVNVV
ncbi:hypothetical protein BGZ65_004846, partial [Modicella reniformis]